MSGDETTLYYSEQYLSYSTVVIWISQESFFPSNLEQAKN